MSEVRVLIIEDEESTRNAILSLLISEAWVLDVVSDTHAALLKLREGTWCWPASTTHA